MALRRKDVYGHWAYYLLFTLFVAWWGVSLLWSKNVSEGVSQFIEYSLFIIFSIIFVDVVRSRDRLKKASYAFLFGMILLMVIEIRMNMLTDFYIYGPDRLGQYLNGPNEFAYQVLVSVPVAWFLLFDTAEDELITKVFALGHLSLATYAIFSSRSRARIGILTFVIVLGLVLNGRSAIKRKYVLPLVGGIAAVSYVVRDTIFTVVDKIMTAFTPGKLGGSLQTRLDLYASAYDYVLSNPLFGAGMGSVREVLGGNESSYTLVGVEMGVVGLLLFVALLVYLSKGTLRRDGRTNMGLLLVVVVVLGSFFDPIINSLETWAVLAVVLVWNRSLAAEHETKF